MSDFSDHWLALRADADSRARADQLLTPLCAGWQGPRQVLDLGAGTGANLRHLAPRLGGEQHWCCVDHDAHLLACLPARTAVWATQAGHRLSHQGDRLRIDGPNWHCRVQRRRLDLAAGGWSGMGIGPGLNGQEPLAPPQGLAALRLPPGGLVTASALLDLVSAAWLQTLLGRCHAARCRLLFALTYDGRCRLSPPHPDDALVRDLVNQHQRLDKGLGPALGPTAVATAAAWCRGLGLQVVVAASDWSLGADEPALQQALISGWCDAARWLAPHLTPRLAAWRRLRGRQVRAGMLGIQVGHQDLIALPAARPSLNPLPLTDSARTDM
ncbi:MAG: class I SAM-dependent methyltransferase [Chromatiaceae bacterium]|nr:MAG: class I SAM-dependent methyltransferase [Chromatiaceae bacterium]